MRLVTMSYNNDRDNDVHVLRDSLPTPDLRPVLILGFETEPGDPPTAVDRFIFASQLDLPANVGLKALLQNGRIDFVANFTVRPEHALTLDAATGAVAAQTPTAAQLAAAGGKIDNFLVRAVGTPVAAGAPVVETPVRFHIHSDIDPDHVTLSPTAMTVRAGGTKPVRFGVLAQFDDSVVGDISVSPNLTWSMLVKDAGGNLVLAPFNAATQNFELSESGSVVLTLGLATGGLTATAAFSTDVFVKCAIELRPADVLETPPAQVFSGGLWSDPAHNPLRVEFIDGDGLARVDTVPNVLIVSDGFRDQDRTIFDTYVRTLVAGIRDSRNADPYRRFLTNRSMNFFSLFIPSRELGCSLLFAVAAEAPDALGDPLPAAEPPDNKGVRALAQLTYVVGLPIPADENLSVDDAIARWTKLYADAFTTTVDTTLLRNDLYAQWTRLASRTIAVARDTALGASAGRRPAAVDSGSGTVGYDPLRVGGDDLRKLLSTEAFVGLSGDKVPALWKTPAAGDTAPAGKDTRLVVVMTLGLPALGTTYRAFDTAFIGTGVALRPVFLNPFNAPNAPWRIVEPDPGDLPPVVFVSTRGTFLHELSHCLRCGDEYGGSEDPPGHDVIFDTQDFGNIVLETTLRGQALGNFDLSKGFSGFYPRIRAAGVLSESPKPEGASFRINLLHGHAQQFKDLIKIGDPLFLRTRPILDSIFALQHPDPSKPSPVPPDFSLALSPKLTLQAFGTDDSLLVSVAGGTIAAKFNVPGPTVPPTPPVSPIIFAPVLDKHGEPLPIMSPLVSDSIKQSMVPNSRKPGQACVPHIDDPKDPDLMVPAQEKVLSMPAAVQSALGIRNLSKVVGLYDKGDRLNCGVFHPTGYCAMRQSSEAFHVKRLPFSVIYRSGGNTEFCHVCRYILIDIVDPTLHAEFDSLYSSIYVEPTT
jgi:hypothetical protein